MRNEDAIFFSSASDVFRRSFHERSRFAAPFRADSETILTARKVLREQINVIVPPFLFRCLLRCFGLPPVSLLLFSRLTSMLLSFCCSSRLLVRECVCVCLCVKSLSWRYATDRFVRVTGAEVFCCCCVFSLLLFRFSLSVWSFSAFRCL